MKPYIVVILAGLECFSCRSIPPQTKMAATVKTGMEARTVETVIGKKESNRTDSLQSGLETSTETVVHTVTIRYDTSFPVDSATGLPPVKEISRSAAWSGLKSQLLQSGIRQQSESLTVVDSVKSEVSAQEDERTEFTQQPGKDPRQWLYIALSVAGLVLLAVLLFRKIF